MLVEWRRRRITFALLLLNECSNYSSGICKTLDDIIVFANLQLNFARLHVKFVCVLLSHIIITIERDCTTMCTILSYLFLLCIDENCAV